MRSLTRSGGLQRLKPDETPCLSWATSFPSQILRLGFGRPSDTLGDNHTPFNRHRACTALRRIAQAIKGLDVVL